MTTKLGDCSHFPTCPEADASDHDAAVAVARHPEQGWTLLCNGTIVFDDLGEILASGRTVAPPACPAPHTSCLDHRINVTLLHLGQAATQLRAATRDVEGALARPRVQEDPIVVAQKMSRALTLMCFGAAFVISVAYAVAPLFTR